jgi:hypothetical protein
VLAAHVLHRAVAAQPGQHDLKLLLRRPAPVLPLLAQPVSSSVERPILSRTPDSPSGATRLRDCPVLQLNYLSTQDRGAGHRDPACSALTPLETRVASPMRPAATRSLLTASTVTLALPGGGYGNRSTRPGARAAA